MSTDMFLVFLLGAATGAFLTSVFLRPLWEREAFEDGKEIGLAIVRHGGDE